MAIVTFFKKLWKLYAADQPVRTDIPDFKPDQLCRWQIIFSGRVQGVGFRMEARELALKLGLTGFCENLPDGNVLAEFQGPENRILFLIAFMESLPRIMIVEKVMIQIPILENDSRFECR